MILQNNDPFTQPSFSFKNRMARAVWAAVWLFLFRPSPRLAHGWRRLLLRMFGAKLGEHVHVHADVKIWAPWHLVVGDRVGVGSGANLYNMALLQIGSGSVISQGAHLCGGTHDIDSDNFQLVAKPIMVGENVWICADAFVGPGVCIADGCVLAARSVLVKNVSAGWTVWAGNPAQLKKQRLKRM